MKLGGSDRRNRSSHKIIHQRLLQKFVEHEKNILRDQSLNAPFFEFLKSWLVTHIRGIDSKYAGKNLDVKSA
jgi:hemerythrin